MFRTYEPAQDRLVAVKAFRLDITPEQARALADELQRIADAGLDHPSLVRLIGAGVEGSLAYSANEYVAAESLDIAVRHYAPAGLDMVLPFITQLAGAVDFARAAGISHGALHPRDIFVTPDEARATGFGVVQALESIGLRAPVRRPYTAPERVDGGQWDVTADVYSLGAIAFELLTGRRPVGSDVGALGSNAGAHAEDVSKVISRALSDDPSRRYPGALAFAAALEASSRGERTTAAIEEVRAVAGDSAAAAPTREEAPIEVHDLTIEQDHADVYVERETDLAEIQLRDEEGPARRWEPERPFIPAAPVIPETESRVASEPPVEVSGQIPPGGPPDDLEMPSVHPAGLEQSLFDLDSDAGGEDGIPEVQHAGFQPGRPVPSDHEGWGEASGARMRVDDTAAQDRRDLSSAPADAHRERRSVVLPVAITLLLGLFVGFLAGYLVFVRDGNNGSAAVTSGTSTTATPEPARESTPPRQPAPAQARPQRPSPTPSAGATLRPTEPTRPPAERPRTSAPAVPARGRLVVRSNPSGALVFVNGRRRGITPLALRDLAPGTYNIRVSREGYADTSRRVSVGGSSVREVSLSLARRAAPSPSRFTGSLYVDSRPRGARVLLDGKEVGVTPMQLGDVRAGAHVVRLELTDHRSWTASARVVAGQVVRVTGSLERMR